jgi:hypothetical protein
MNTAPTIAGGARHEDADTTAVTVERSDVIDAAAGLLLLARQQRRQAKSRQFRGPRWAGYRAGLRQAADVADAAAHRMQRAADEAL